MSEKDIVVGKHVYGNLYDIEESRLGNEEYIKQKVLEAVEKSRSTLIEIKSWTIPGKKGGVSVIALVDESHIAVHTWVEYKYATVDIYTCGAHTDPWAAFLHLVKALKPKAFRVYYADRSSNTL